jgi:transcriptional regulator with XRE-family HTH domain
MRNSDAADTDRRRVLAQFLRDRRERLAPAAVGLATGRRRRAKGLLREEVAQAAGIGVTWYTWLEQARTVTPSPRAVDGLARALRLDAAERAHLFRLARPDLEPASAINLVRELPAPLQRALAGLSPHPAYAVNAMWDVIGWNAPAVRLFGDFARFPAERRNILWLLFCEPDWGRLFVAIEAIRDSAVAQFRATTARLAADPGFLHFVKALGQASPDFQALWHRRDVREPAALHKDLAHPKLGRLSLDYATFRPDGIEDVRFTIYMPADARTKKALSARTA